MFDMGIVLNRKQGICHDKGMMKDERRFDKLSTNLIEGNDILDVKIKNEVFAIDCSL